MNSESEQKINYIAMTQVCSVCDKDCEIAWSDGTCEIFNC